MLDVYTCSFVYVCMFAGNESLQTVGMLNNFRSGNFGHSMGPIFRKVLTKTSNQFSHDFF